MGIWAVLSKDIHVGLLHSPLVIKRGIKVFETRPTTPAAEARGGGSALRPLVVVVVPYQAIITYVIINFVHLTHGILEVNVTLLHYPYWKLNLM